MTAWPEALPPFTAEGYGRKPQPGGVRFAPDRGPAKQRLTSRASPWDVTYRLELTYAQRQAFWAFWEDDCKRGALDFTMADPIGGGTKTWRFIIGAEPSETITTPYFVVTFQAELLPG